MSELDAINYAPLFAMQGTWQRVFKSMLHGWQLGLTALVVVVSIGLLFISSGPPFSLAIIVAYSVMLSYKVTKLKNAAWEAFALINNWSLDTATPLGVIVPPSLQFGHSPTFSPVIQAQLGDVTCDILAYSTTTGSSRYQHVHNYTVGALTLPTALPHMLLLSKKTKVDVERDLQNGEELHLEGDFNDYFSLQIEKGQEIDALSVITPDVMQKLVDYNQAEDIEILGTNLYFMLSHDKRDYRNMQLFIQSIMELSGQITHSG